MLRVSDPELIAVIVVYEGTLSEPTVDMDIPTDKPVTEVTVIVLDALALAWQASVLHVTDACVHSAGLEVKALPHGCAAAMEKYIDVLTEGLACPATLLLK